MQAKKKKQEGPQDGVSQAPESPRKSKRQKQLEEVEVQGPAATADCHGTQVERKSGKQAAEADDTTADCTRTKRRRQKQVAAESEQEMCGRSRTTAVDESARIKQKRQTSAGQEAPDAALSGGEEHDGDCTTEQHAEGPSKALAENAEAVGEATTGSLLELRRLLTPAAVETTTAATVTAPDDLEWTSRRYVVNASDPPVPFDQLASPVHPAVEASLRKAGYSALFPIQAVVIPLLLRCTQTSYDEDSPYSCDVCVAAPTGQGKTLAYAVPVVQGLLHRLEPQLRALVIVPTRDLAMQVFRVFSRLCHGLAQGVARVRTLCLTGEQSMRQEQRMLKESTPDIVVCTPGRLADHVLGRYADMDLSTLQWFVADEADRLLTQTFHRWLDVLGRVNELARSGLARGRRVQKLLLSATMTWNPQKLAALKLHRPIYFSSSATGKHATPAELRQLYVPCLFAAKPLVVLHILRRMLHGELDGLPSPKSRKAVVFCPSVDIAHRLTRLLQICCSLRGKAGDDSQAQEEHSADDSGTEAKHVDSDDDEADSEDGSAVEAEDPAGHITGFGLEAKEVAEFSSNLTQRQRSAVLGKFRRAMVKCLVCSDVVSRGIDIPEVSTVINYNKPPFLQNYIHRVGRTARAGRVGYTFTLLQRGQVSAFTSMLQESADCSERLQEHVVPAKQRRTTQPWYTRALRELKRCLELEERGEHWEPGGQTAETAETAEAGEATGDAKDEAAEGVADAVRGEDADATGVGEVSEGEDDPGSGGAEASDKAKAAGKAEGAGSAAAAGGVAAAREAYGTMLDFVQATVQSRRAALTRPLW